MIEKSIIKQLHKHFSIIPLRGGTDNPKAPSMTQWQVACKKKQSIDFCFGKEMIGIACGFEGLEVIDIDNPFGDAEILLSYILDNVPFVTELKLPINKTGGGGYHILYKCDKPNGNEKLARRGKKTIVETRGNGGQIVYYLNSIEQGNDILSGNVPHITDEQKNELWQFCKSLNEEIKLPIIKKDVEGKGKAGDVYNALPDIKERTIRLLEEHGWTATNNQKTEWRRPGKRSGVSATFGKIENYFYCFSTNADPFLENTTYTPMGVLAELEHGGDYRKTAAAIGNELGIKPKEKKGNGSKKWAALEGIIRDWQIKFRYNNLTRVLEATKKGKKVETLNLLLGDISREMELNRGVTSIGKGKITEMIESSVISESFNPMHEFFRSLPKWNGFDNVKALCNCIELEIDENREYFESMMRKHIIRAIRCAREDDYINRIALVFHGPQKIGKSKFWQWLVPTNLYNEEPVAPDNKDSILSLSRYLIINLEELDSMQKKEMHKIKAFISRSKVTQRVAYGRNDEEFIRIASFVGSTNKSDILTDDANTRWIFLKVKKFDWKKYTIELDSKQLWAQCLVELNKDKEAGELTVDEELQSEARNNEEFLGITSERELLEAHFKQVDRDNLNAQAMTMSEIKILIELAKHPIKLQEFKLSRELQRLFGTPKRTTYNGKNGRFYFLITDLKRPGSQWEYNGGMQYENITQDDEMPF